VSNSCPVPRHPMPVKWYEDRSRWVNGCLVYKLSIARRIYERRHGKLSRWIFVCHTCDNPYCILDAHHFLGTPGDNIRDSVSKGRHSCLRVQSEAEKSRRSKTVLKRLKDPKVKAEWQAVINLPAQRQSVSNAAKKLWRDPVRRAALMAARYTPEKRKDLSSRAKKQLKVAGKFA
jgi:hypothetical protein